MREVDMEGRSGLLQYLKYVKMIGGKIMEVMVIVVMKLMIK